HRWEFLNGPGNAGGFREVPQLALMGIVARPECLNRRDDLAQVFTTFTLVHAAGHAVKFILVSAASQPQLQPSINQRVAETSLARQPDGIPVRRGDDSSP